MLRQDWSLDSAMQGGPSSQFLASSEEKLKKLLREHEQRIVEAVVQSVHPLLSGSRLGEQPYPSADDLGPHRAKHPRAKDVHRLSEIAAWQVTDEVDVGDRASSADHCAARRPAGRQGAERTPTSIRSAASTSELHSSPAVAAPRSDAQGGIPRSSLRDSWFRDSRPNALSKMEESTSKLELESVHEEPVGPQKNFAARLIARKWFGLVVAVLILVNVAAIGMQADFTIRNLTSDMPVWFQVLDIFFAITFTIEMSLRVWAEGWTVYSVHNPNLNWNLFDTLLVIAAVIEEIFKRLWSEAPDMSAMRGLRMMRFVRVARIVRVARMFSDLRIMVGGIMSSARSFMWAMLLLFLFGFMFGVLILEIVSVELYSIEANPDQRTPEVEIEQATLREHWGSLPTASYTLFLSICGGVDWGDVAGPLMQISPMMGGLFCVYIALSIFCVLNIVTGVFVENTKTMLSKDETQLIMETMDARKQWLEEVKLLWGKLEVDDKVSLENFTKRVEDLRVQALFRQLGLDVASENACGLFNLLDFDGSGELEIDEFATGIQMLHGQAKNIDMARLHHLVRGLQRQLETLSEHLGARPRPADRCRSTRASEIVVRPAPVSAPVPPPSLPGFLEEVLEK